jgi:hypothetical protein
MWFSFSFNIYIYIYIVKKLNVLLKVNVFLLGELNIKTKNSLNVKLTVSQLGDVFEDNSIGIWWTIDQSHDIVEQKNDIKATGFFKFEAGILWLKSVNDIS